MTLFEIRLPEGDLPGFDIGGRGDNGSRQYDPQTWLSKGFSGVRFIGAGKGRTHIRPASGVWTNLFVEQHAGQVRFESLSIHGRGRAALMAGRDHPTAVVKQFKIALQDFELIADDPTSGMQSSVKWGGFFYQCDTELVDGDIWYLYSSEHAFYHHGAASLGTLAERLRFHQVGAECLKFRPDPEETLYAGKRVKYVIRQCHFQDWYRPWSDRGGAGIVVQGGAADILVDRCEFWAPNRSQMHTRCVMVDDGGGAFYDKETGRVGIGFANGYVAIKNSGFRAGPGSENLSPVMRVGALGSGQRVARSLLVENCGLYGENLQLQMGDIPSGRTIVRGCNTPAIRDIAQARGYDVAHEALIPLADHTIPVSHGLVR